MSIHCLPVEIIQRIIELIDGPRPTLCNLARTCSAFRSSVLPVLYRRVNLIDDKVNANITLYRFLRSLDFDPSLGSYVRFFRISLDRGAIGAFARLIARTIPSMCRLTMLEVVTAKLGKSSIMTHLLCQNLPQTLQWLCCDINCGPDLWNILERLPLVEHLYVWPSTEHHECTFPAHLVSRLVSCFMGPQCMAVVAPSRPVERVGLRGSIRGSLVDCFGALARTQTITKLSIRTAHMHSLKTIMGALAVAPITTLVDIHIELRRARMSHEQQEWTKVLSPLQALKFLTVKLGPDGTSRELCQKTVQEWISTCPQLVRGYLSVFKVMFDAPKSEHICVWWERNRIPNWLISEGPEKLYVPVNTEPEDE